MIETMKDMNFAGNAMPRSNPSGINLPLPRFEAAQVFGAFPGVLRRLPADESPDFAETVFPVEREARFGASEFGLTLNEVTDDFRAALWRFEPRNPSCVHREQATGLVAD